MATRAILSLMLIFAVWMAVEAHPTHNEERQSLRCEVRLRAILALVTNFNLPTIEAALSYIPKDMNDCVTFISARCPNHGPLINQICTAYFNKKNA